MQKLIASALLASLALAAIAQIDPAKVILRVNGEEVKAGEYYRRMEYLDGVSTVLSDLNQDVPPGLLTIDRLVTEKLLGQVAKAKMVLPTEVEVQKEVTLRTTNNPTLLATWTKSGRTAAELTAAVRTELTRFRLQTLGITATDAEVDKFIKDSPERFITPKQVTLRVVVVDSAITKLSVDDDLKAGKAFSAVAEKFSVDQSSKVGGNFGTFSLPKLPKSIQDAVAKLTAGQTSAWIQYGEKSPYQAKFLVEQATPEKTEPVTPALKEEMRRELMIMRGRVKNDLQKWFTDARKVAKIEVLQPGFAEAYADLLKKTGPTVK